jgi:hypothetical protein
MKFEKVTDDNYLDALRKICELWDAPEGSEEFIELEALTALVDAYEKQKYNI